MLYTQFAGFTRNPAPPRLLSILLEVLLPSLNPARNFTLPPIRLHSVLQKTGSYYIGDWIFPFSDFRFQKSRESCVHVCVWFFLFMRLHTHTRIRTHPRRRAVGLRHHMCGMLLYSNNISPNISPGGGVCLSYIILEILFGVALASLCRHRTSLFSVRIHGLVCRVSYPIHH